MYTSTSAAHRDRSTTAGCEIRNPSGNIEALALASRSAERLVSLIHSRGPTTRGGYDGEDGSEREPRDATAASIHG